MASKAGRREEKRPPAAVPQPAKGRAWWWYALAPVTLLAAYIAYAPAMQAPFLFDDSYLPFGLPNYDDSLWKWIGGGVRPALMLTYWLNSRIAGESTYSYHVVNLILHSAAALLVFLIVRRLLEWTGTVGSRRDLLSGIAAALFLLHPLQAESVAYIAGRSECLSVLFLLAAFAVFLDRPDPAIGWPRAMAVLGLFLAALASKEHAVALVPLLLLADLWFSPDAPVAAVRRNWRLYAPLVAGALAGVAFFWSLITRASTAGFGMRDLTWYQYLFTQFRALWVYVRLFFLPVGQNLDPDFPISRSIAEHGALLGLAGLLVASAAAWYYRRRYPLAAFGWFAFLLLMAPTSSILPIKDPIAERRVYLSILGLLLVVTDALRQTRLGRNALAGILAVVLVAGMALSNARAQVWSSASALWEDTARKSPNKLRPRFQLANAYYQEGRCDLASAEYAAAAKLEKPSYDLLIDWGLALECAGRADDAVATLHRAAAIESNAHVYSQIGMVYAKQKRWAEALEALGIAERADPNYPITWVYKGGVHLATGDAAQAAEDYRRALRINSADLQAREGLAMAERMLAAPR